MTAIDRSDKSVTTASGETIGYDTPCEQRIEDPDPFSGQVIIEIVSSE